MSGGISAKLYKQQGQMLLQQGPSFTKGDSEGNSNSEDMRIASERCAADIDPKEVGRGARYLPPVCGGGQ
eukprot:1918052-Amphidinium_carterae.1